MEHGPRRENEHLPEKFREIFARAKQMIIGYTRILQTQVVVREVILPTILS